LYKQTTRLRRFAARDRALTGWRRPYPGAKDGSILHALTEARQAFAEGVEKVLPVRAHVADYLGPAAGKRAAPGQGLRTGVQPPSGRTGHRPLCRVFEQWSQASADTLQPFVEKYGERKEGEPERLDKALLKKRKQGGSDMLRDLHDLWLLVNESMVSLDVIEQAASQTLVVPS
jgi:ferredoxin-nitrate reductase